MGIEIMNEIQFLDLSNQVDIENYFWDENDLLIPIIQTSINVDKINFNYQKEEIK